MKLFKRYLSFIYSNKINHALYFIIKYDFRKDILIMLQSQTFLNYFFQKQNILFSVFSNISKCIQFTINS